jgi:3-oxoacyl-[acyl-carrier-protein] synthase II
MGKRVVVTGVGMVTPSGKNTKETWRNMTAGKSGIQSLDFGEGNPNVGGKIQLETNEMLDLIGNALGKDFLKSIKKSFLNGMDRFSRLILLATTEAIKQSKLTSEELESSGTSIGTSIGGISTLEEQYSKMKEGGKITPFTIPSILGNLAAANVAKTFGCKGSQSCASTACASGGSAIIDGLIRIRHGYSDVMICGAVEAALTKFIVAGFNATKALSNNPDPKTASRPFHSDRDGFVVSEGAAVLVLESLKSAQERNAPILAEIVGFGESCDAHHLTNPNKQGPILAVRKALNDAGISPKDIDLIIAHATSTSIGDVNEISALFEVFGDMAKKVMLTAPKSLVGHLLGASGAIGAIIAVLSILYGTVLPTLGLDEIASNCDLGFDIVKETRQEQSNKNVLTNAFGFGGANTCLIFRKFI